MKKSKKLIVSLAAVALATVPVITTSLNQAHAAQTTDQTQNKITADGTLTLNHNTRIYNKKGQKLYSYQRSNGLLKKGATVSYVDKPQTIADPDTVRYSFHDDDWNWFYLPYKTIKGQEYYSIGHGGYVKAANVDKINGNSLYTNSEAIVTKKWSLESVLLYDGHGNLLSKRLQAGQKLILDRKSTINEFGKELSHIPPVVRNMYRIKGTDEFIRDCDIKTTIRHELPFYSVYTQVYLLKDAPYYDKDGKELSHALPKGTDVSIAKAFKITNVKEKNEELFYQLGNNPRCFVKASDVKYLAGPKLPSSDN